MHREICCTGISHMCCASALLDVIRDMSLYTDVYQTDGSIPPANLMRSMARLDQAKADGEQTVKPNPYSADPSPVTIGQELSTSDIRRHAISRPSYSSCCDRSTVAQVLAQAQPVPDLFL